MRPITNQQSGTDSTQLKSGNSFVTREIDALSGASNRACSKPMEQASGALDRLSRGPVA
jgi:hypothetical protein